MTSSMQVDIVSTEQAIFSGSAKMLYASGTLGELGIAPGHAQLLSTLKPGQVRVVLEDGFEEVFYISGGILEVQPFVVTVLADSALRAADIDEAAAQEARQNAARVLAEAKGSIGFSAAAAELARATAQLSAINQLRKFHDKL